MSFSSTSRLFSFGSNGKGQLGVGHDSDVAVPTPCKLPAEATAEVGPPKVIAGGNHTLILFPSGNAYAAGQNTYGELGSTLDASSKDFMKMSIGTTADPDTKLAFLAATWSSSIAVSRDNGVYTFGNPAKGVLGRGIDVPSQPSRPEKIVGFPPPGDKIVDLATGVDHVVAVLSTGEAYGWGSSGKGQLGTPFKPGGVDWSPRKIEDVPFAVSHAVCGHGFTYLAGDPALGLHIVLGTDKWRIKQAAPHQIKDWSDISASWGNIFVLSNGILQGWGRNDHGQLPPANIPTIKAVSAGSEHVVALSTDGKVLVWGWGEHGNCGPTADHDGDVKNRWFEIDPLVESLVPSAACGIGAGCATSWIWTS